MTEQDPFKSASFGEQITENLDRLLLVTPREYQTGLVTKFNNKEKPTSDAVLVDFVVLDLEDGPEEFTDALVFQGPLIRTFKAQAKYNEANPSGDPKTGFPQMTLGRLERGEDKKGLGENKRPWIMSPPSEEDKVRARDYLAGRKSEPDDPFA